MLIGIPKEIMHGERRVSAIPETVAKLVKDGAEVWVEKNAGEGAFFHDNQYVQAGAKIVDDVAVIYEKADVILKVKEPQFNHEKNLHEVDMMHAGQVLITFIHPASPVNHDMVRAMAKKGVVGLTLDGVPRITRAQSMDALTSMSTCAGYKGILLAANELPKFIPQIFSAVGMIKPINALIVGVGVGGLQALATAKRLGAVVYAADIRPAASEQAKSLGAKVIELGVPPEAAIGEGGYALPLSDEWLEKERAVLAAELPKMDIVFLSALVPSRIAPILITEDMVKAMKPGAAIVDISIDQGGNCEITPPGEVEVKHNVTLIGIKNIPGMLPESSSWMFAQNIYNLTKYLTKDGKIVLDRNDDIVKGILTTIDGEIVHQGAREAMGL
ncbi:MAG TPA: NAD(P) transhydrogenase subunit alpha [Candidatus Avichristensenella intestinipullorum]|uniref:proton-translocating NAD(P)(+) transhydrogenase n=1 Tax=Candidatus Avichristensenella intestinipullorum TaxID=2840693 RepID=A0A9D1CIV3_9FIRM|nr:NAD(P) transhydrogenase subunit alpha [Candidatus Avichristensenella intestinipullorum]